ncbi:GNAT family N-acetyltransferase [Alkalihalobacillus pseudalcaliphilus]|uniref:GNAT family N-acetyltransferase n=1 Tax=Alkalihalobacillus pseudalcaliphilus TaxID=79884 RepID=UPI00069D2E7D|nr:GNAT family N-acetyltransferase [Alkalihalobacillus pseudalcaliphilus]
MTTNIILKEYKDEYAEEVAKMWNLSRDSWGGDDTVMTAEKVIKKEANSDNLTLYLAFDKQEVVGYCGLSIYKEDKGSLYIPLLNVRPDYHGKKIGKLLVLKAIERTVELGWGRLDLFTWPGNTKAVPLYKKCGFFWEDRDDTTHLMNFVPTVLQTDLLKPFFKQADWYTHNKKLIDVKPDGLKKNGFTYYTYDWSFGKEQLSVEIERTSRGISKIETNDVIVELTLLSHDIIEEEQQTFHLNVINKNKKPLHIEAVSISDSRVLSSFSVDEYVSDEAIFSGKVTVGKGEEPSPWNTHPTLKVDLKLNGVQGYLSLGVNPKPAIKLQALMQPLHGFIDETGVIELELVNQLQEDAQVSIVFPQNEYVALDKEQISLHLSSRQRSLIQLPFTTKKFGSYQPTIHMNVKAASGNEYNIHNAHIGLLLKGFGSSFFGQSKKEWYIANGIYDIRVTKRNHILSIYRKDEAVPFHAFPPQLGRPFSSEFFKDKPVAVKSYQQEGAIVLESEFHSNDFPGIQLFIYHTLYADGLLKRELAVNNTNEPLSDPLRVLESIHFDKEHAFIPLGEEVIEYSNELELNFGQLPTNKKLGNWMFTSNNGKPLGVSWSTEAIVNPEGWKMNLEYKTGHLTTSEHVTFKPLIVSIGAFQTWQEQQVYAEQSNKKKQTLTEHHLSFNQESLLICDEEHVNATFKTSRAEHLNGTLSFTINERDIQKVTIHESEEKAEYSTTIQTKGLQPLSNLKASLNNNKENIVSSALILTKSGSVEKRKEDHADYETWILNNGPIEIKVAPSFFPGMYSLKHNNHEWLDTSFPQPIAKGWWNPWLGGMTTQISKLNMFSYLKATSTAEFIEVEDTNNNLWSAIAIQTTLSNHEVWGNTTFTQYFATLPGIPILSHFIKFDTLDGKSLIGEELYTNLFLTSNHISDLAIQKDSLRTARAGSAERSILSTGEHYITSSSSNQKLFIVTHARKSAYMNKDVFENFLEQDASCISKPVFLIFHEDILNKKLLQPFDRIQFKVRSKYENH